MHEVAGLRREVLAGAHHRGVVARPPGHVEAGVDEALDAFGVGSHRTLQRHLAAPRHDPPGPPRELDVRRGGLGLRQQTFQGAVLERGDERAVGRDRGRLRAASQGRRDGVGPVEHGDAPPRGRGFDRVLVEGDAGESGVPVAERELERIEPERVGLQADRLGVHHDGHAPALALDTHPLRCEDGRRDRREGDDDPRDAGQRRHEVRIGRDGGSGDVLERSAASTSGPVWADSPSRKLRT